MVPENIIWDDSEDEEEEDAYFTQVPIYRQRTRYRTGTIYKVSKKLFQDLWIYRMWENNK